MKKYDQRNHGQRKYGQINYFTLFRKQIIITLAIILIVCAQTVTMNAEAKEEPQVTNATYDQGTVEQKVDAIMKQYIGTTIEGAAVAVVKEDKIIYQKGYGYADERANILVDPQTTLFEYGSVSKLFVWISAMQLAQQGKLDLNADVRTYLPKSFQDKFQYEDKVTMLNLMNHTAGFDGYIIGLFNQKDNMKTLEKWLLDTDVKQYMKPGQESVYSNYGAALAGFIVEQVSGMEFRDYVKQNIYEKAGLTNIYPESVLPDSMSAHKSKAYKMDSNQLKEANATYISAYPAGAANGTVVELANFAMAILKDSSPLFVSDQARNELYQTSWLPEHGVQGIGMSHGFFQYQSEQLVLWHNGETTNFNSFFLLIPKEKMAVCIVCNTGGEKVLNAEREIAFSFVPDWEKSASTELKSADLVSGSYQSLRRCHHGITQLLYAITPVDKKVMAKGNGTITIAGEDYQQVEPYLYYCKDSGRSVSFTTDDQGVVIGCHQLVGFRKISSVQIMLCYMKVGLLLVTFLVILAYGIRKKGWYGRIAACILFLVGNVVVMIIRALQLNYFSSIRVLIVLNYIATAIIFVMAALQIKKEWNKNIGKRKMVLFYVSVIAFCSILASYGLYHIVG